MKVKSLPEGDYPIDVKVNYRDASGEWKEKNLESEIKIHNSAAQQDTGTLVMYLVVIVVVLAVIVWYFKLRKPEKVKSR